MTRRHFPFSGVVGQQAAKLALTLSAVDPTIGGVLLYGDKGSAKSTLARGLASLLGPTTPFVELPLSTTEDRLIGSLDVVAALQDGALRFRDGLLAKAHGGVLYVDEVNLLPDHLVDLLLDVAASGINRVEREGISHEHPARFVLIGSMNPEEGELRPQLLDRFAFGVDVVSHLDVHERVQAIVARLAFERDGDQSLEAALANDRELAGRIEAARPLPVTNELVEVAASMAIAAGAQGLRADLALCRGAAALASLHGEQSVGIAHLRAVAPLVFAHRRLHPPPELADQSLSERLEQAIGAPREAEAPDSAQPSPSGQNDGSSGADLSSGGAEDGYDEGTSQGSDGAPSSEAPSGSQPMQSTEKHPEGFEEQLYRVTPLSMSRPTKVRTNQPGRDRAIVEGHGRVIGTTSAPTIGGEIAIGATLQSAAARRALDPPQEGERLVTHADLRVLRRESRAGRTVVIAVDVSASMHTARRVSETRSAILSLLVDAYQRRDRFGLVTFGGHGAHVALRPTSSPEVAKARLSEIATGGLTPLGSGLRVARELVSQLVAPLVILITDGRATLAHNPDDDPWEETLREAAAYREARLESVVIDVEEARGALGLARRLSDAMGGSYHPIDTLAVGALERSVQELLG
jgi:magnesium chelatase subunit D